MLYHIKSKCLNISLLCLIVFVIQACARPILITLPRAADELFPPSYYIEESNQPTSGNSCDSILLKDQELKQPELSNISNVAEEDPLKEAKTSKTSIANSSRLLTSKNNLQSANNYSDTLKENNDSFTRYYRATLFQKDSTTEIKGENLIAIGIVIDYQELRTERDKKTKIYAQNSTSIDTYSDDGKYDSVIIRIKPDLNYELQQDGVKKDSIVKKILLKNKISKFEDNVSTSSEMYFNVKPLAFINSTGTKEISIKASIQYISEMGYGTQEEKLLTLIVKSDDWNDQFIVFMKNIYAITLEKGYHFYVVILGVLIAFLIRIIKQKLKIEDNS